MKRYTARAFPPYRHEPGNTPHPERSPEGYRYGREAEPRPFLALKWRDNEDYLFGVDLLNAAYFWEAHAVWEELWVGTTDEPTRSFLQALIQTAAACLKQSTGQGRGARKLFRAARARFEKLPSSAAGFAGVDVAALRADIEAIEAGESSGAIRIALRH